MRALVLGAVLAFVPSIARADAIMPFDGECPPGLREGIAGHAEVCEPLPCTADTECGARAACRPIAECWAPRPFSPSGGRVFGDEETRDQVIGLCSPAGACAEGHCETRRQCEPTVSTEAWDPAARRWTGETYRGGCSVARGARSPSIAWLSFGALLAALALRSRRVRRAPSARAVRRAGDAHRP